ncbi:hypothetical protein C2S52_018507 [Perilla frutescens var. hirtella]|nr:hypothetical protein C2S52_018507 [Perilla frutescens var. hirtella]
MEINLLFEAAREGKVEVLERLLQENPSILADSRLVSPSESLLHAATKFGQFDFVHELMKLDPQIARDMNQYGFRPLDIASIMGKTAIVKAMLSSNGDLCRVAGKDSRTALHYAAINGRVEIIHHLLSTFPDCLQDITVHGETALHLAVKYYQFDAFCQMVNSLERLSKMAIINGEDGDGNTVLHLAVSTKQYACLNILVGENSSMRGTLKLNVRNGKGLTALDVSDMVIQDFYDVKVRETLQHAGAKRAQECTSITAQLETNHDHHLHHRESRNWFEYFKFQKQRDSPSEARNTLLVVAALITTVTFQAAANPPLGLFDESRVIQDSSVVGVGAFKTDLIFVFFNSIGFITSSLILCYLTIGFPLHRELVVSLGSMFITYSAAFNVYITGSKAGAGVQAIAWYVQLAALILPHLFRRPPWFNLRRIRAWCC